MNEMTVVELKLTHRAIDVRDPRSRQMMFMGHSHMFNTEVGLYGIPDPKEPIPVEYRSAERFFRHADGKTESFWVLWSPEVEKVIGMPMGVIDAQQRRIDSLHKEIDKHSEAHAATAKRAQEYAKRITNFYSLPWYKRAWLAMRGTGV